jgi:hypothetical protein
VNEKYEANPKGLMPFRVPTADEVAIIASLPLPVPADSIAQTAVKPPPGIEYFDDGLNDITRINEDWEMFKDTHTHITCEKISDTTFQVLVPLLCLIVDIIPETCSILRIDYITRYSQIETNVVHASCIIPKISIFRPSYRHYQRTRPTQETQIIR